LKDPGLNGYRVRLGTSDQQLAAFIALSRDLSRLFPLRGAGREISTGQLLIARSPADRRCRPAV